MNNKESVAATLTTEVYKKAELTKEYLSGDDVPAASVLRGNIDNEIDFIVEIYQKILSQLS